MSFEEPTQRLTVQPRNPPEPSASQTTAALPRPLNLAGPTPPSSPEPADKTDELSLDEIFAAPQPPAAQPPTAQPPAAEGSRAEEAPTWTAMPVIPVRSEPVRAPEPAPRQPDTAQTRAKRTGPSIGERLLTDASRALDGTIRRSQAWLSHNDNGLMLMTAAVAIILILVVAAVGS